jgi:sugar/nucleoside kinase (ribokinase family)
MLVCTLGDLVLDVIVAPGGQLVPGDDVPASTHVAPGGQAANVAAWTVALGGRARFIGARGDDATGRLVDEELGALGVEVAGPVGGRTGVVVALVGADRDRSMASDRGSSAGLAPDALDARWFDGCDWLHVSGYMLGGEPGASAAAAACSIARAAGARVSLDVASATLVRAVGAGRFGERAAAVAPDVLFATDAEHAALEEAASAATIVVKRGALGCRILRGTEEATELPAVSATVVDTTGAGDAFAAGYLVGGAALALDAGARCVARTGAMP